MTYRVIQWATGQCGKVSMRAVLERRDMELVGGRVFSPDKVGCDLGELAGLGSNGVLATDDEDELLALDADCVLWMAALPMGPDRGVDELCRILASGKNLITIVHEYLLPPSIPDHERVAIESACATGNSTFHIAGMSPGYYNEVLTPQLASLCRRLDRIEVREILDYSQWHSPQLLWFMGFGEESRSEGRMVDIAEPYFASSVHFIAASLGTVVDKVELHQDEVLAHEDFDVPIGHIRRGTVAAMRFGYTGYVDGEPRFVYEHINRLRPDLAPDWPQGRGYYVDLLGDPRLQVGFELGAPEGGDETTATLRATAMRAVNGIPVVCEAPPGRLTAKDLPMIDLAPDDRWVDGLFGRML